MEVLTKPRNALSRQYGAMFDMYGTGLVRYSPSHLLSALYFHPQYCHCSSLASPCRHLFQ